MSDALWRQGSKWDYGPIHRFNSGCRKKMVPREQWKEPNKKARKAPSRRTVDIFHDEHGIVAVNGSPLSRENDVARGLCVLLRGSATDEVWQKAHTMKQIIQGTEYSCSIRNEPPKCTGLCVSIDKGYSSEDFEKAFGEEVLNDGAQRPLAYHAAIFFSTEVHCSAYDVICQNSSDQIKGWQRCPNDHHNSSSDEDDEDMDSLRLDEPPSSGGAQGSDQSTPSSGSDQSGSNQSPSSGGSDHSGSPPAPKSSGNGDTVTDSAIVVSCALTALDFLAETDLPDDELFVLCLHKAYLEVHRKYLISLAVEDCANCIARVGFGTMARMVLEGLKLRRDCTFPTAAQFRAQSVLQVTALIFLSTIHRFKRTKGAAHAEDQRRLDREIYALSTLALRINSSNENVHRSRRQTAKLRILASDISIAVRHGNTAVLRKIVATKAKK